MYQSMVELNIPMMFFPIPTFVIEHSLALIVELAFLTELAVVELGVKESTALSVRFVYVVR